MVSRMVHSRRSWITWIWIALGAGVLILCWNLALGAAADSPKSTAGKAPAAAPAIPPDLQKVLDRNSLKIASGNLTIAGEGELAKMHSEVPKLKKSLIGAERELRAIEDEVEQISQQLSDCKLRDLELNAQLAQVTNTLQNNQIVGSLNALRRQMDLAIEQQKALGKRLKEAMGKASDAREKYVEHVLNMRSKADEISSEWSRLTGDQDLQDTVVKINSATGKKLKLAPSSGFVTAEKKLQTLEHTVLSESIPITTENSGALMVNVTIDGKHRCQMQIDSGASTVTMSYAMAKEMGLEPKKTDPKVTGVLADGSEVQATRIKLASIRVGKFTAENIECDVFEPRAVNASALLGMSFLGNFKFEVDQQKSELRMVKVDSGDSPKGKAAAKEKKTGAKPAAGKSKAKPDDELD